MILVRDVFQLKFGKAKEAKALWKEAAALAKKYGMPEGRALTDLTGTYYTFVMESTYKSLTDWENSMSDPTGADEWGKWYQKFAPLLDGDIARCLPSWTSRARDRPVAPRRVTMRPVAGSR